MSVLDQRTLPLQSLYNKIKAICEAHPAIASFDCGDLQDYSDNNYSYPAAYLETINSVSENEKANAETYSIALNILDLIDEEATQAEIIRTHDKVKQVFQEIKAFMQLRNVFGETRVSPASSLLFNDFSNDKLVRFRGEFTITVDLLRTPPAELLQIFTKYNG